MNKMVKQGLFIGGLLSLIGLMTFLSAAEAKGGIDAIFTGSKKIIIAGSVIAAAYGGYKIAFTDEGKGVHWFLLVIGGAFAGNYEAVTGWISSIFA